MRSATAAARRDDHQEQPPPPPPLLADRKHVRAVIRAIEELRYVDEESTCNLGTEGMRRLAHQLRVPYLFLVLVDASYYTANPQLTPADLAELQSWAGLPHAFEAGITDPTGWRWREACVEPPLNYQATNPEREAHERGIYNGIVRASKPLRTLLAKCAASLRLA